MATSYAECTTQIERIHLYWATYQRIGYDRQSAQAAKQEVLRHVGTEKGVEEIWEVLYFLKSSDAAKFYYGLVRRYLDEAYDIWSLVRLHVFLRFQMHDGSFQTEIVPKMLCLHMTPDQREDVLNLVLCHEISMCDYRRYVHSTILRSLGMQ